MDTGRYDVSNDIRVLIVNRNGSIAPIRDAMEGVKTPISCICPVDPPLAIKKVLMHLEVVVHGPLSQYDAVIVDIQDKDLSERIACEIINKIPWQTVIIVGKAPMSDPTYAVSFVPNMIGAVVEMKRMKLIV